MKKIMQEEKTSINNIMDNDKSDLSFQEFLDQKMKEVEAGNKKRVIQNIINKRKQNQRETEKQTVPLNLDYGEEPNRVYDMKNPEDAEIVKSKFNKMIEDLRKQINVSSPTLKQINTQYPNV